MYDLELVKKLVGEPLLHGSPATKRATLGLGTPEDQKPEWLKGL